MVEGYINKSKYIKNQHGENIEKLVATDSKKLSPSAKIDNQEAITNDDHAVPLLTQPPCASPP